MGTESKQSNADNLNNVRRESSMHFRERKEYVKDKTCEIETNGDIKNITDLYRGMNNFKKGYQPRNNIVKDERGDLITDPTLFWLGGGIISLSCSMYMGLVMVGRVKYTQQIH
jgi:hypothetical protein